MSRGDPVRRAPRRWGRSEGPSYWFEIAPRAGPGAATVPDRADLVVVGGGVMGVAVAYWASRLGSSVVVLEARRLGWGASGRNIGLLLPSTSSLESLQNIERILDEEHIEADYRKSGHLALASSESVLERMRDERSRRPPGASRLEVLDPAACEELLQMRISDKFLGGRWFRDGATIHPIRFLRGLAAAAVRRGARVYEGVAARAVTPVPGREATDVRTTRGRIRARHVVLAASIRTRRFVPRHRAVLAPVRGQVLATHRIAPVFRMAMAVDWGAVYWRQSPDGTVLVGGCRGRDPEAECSAREVVNPRIQAALASFLPQAFPGFPRFEVARRWAGVMDETPDGRPLVGAWPRCSGRWIVAGFDGHGLPPALGVGRAVGEEIVSGRPAAALEAYDPGRFSPVPRSKGTRRPRRPVVVVAEGGSRDHGRPA